MTPFLLSLVTPLTPQWIWGVQSAHLNQCTGLLWGSLKITTTITGALANRPDQINIMDRNPPWKLLKISVVTSIVKLNRFRSWLSFIRFFVKKQKTHMYKQKNDPVRTLISTVLSPWDSPMCAFSPSTIQTNHSKHASTKTHAFHNTLSKPTKYKHVDPSISLLKINVFSTVVKKQIEHKH